MKRKLTIIALLALGCSLASTAQQTKIITADKHNEYGLVYSLPITGLRFDVTATHTLRTAGPFSQYAKRYVGTDRVVASDSEVWTITDVKIVPYGIPDMENQYLMQLKPGVLTFLSVSDDGMLLAINKEVQPAPVPAPPVAPESAARPTGREYLQYVNEDFTASQSGAKQARLLAEALVEIRDAKVSLTRGTAETMPTDGRQLELMLASLADQENAITQAFTGTEWSETVVRSYTFVPEEAGASTLFRMSDFAGFVDAEDYSGAPVTVKVEVLAEGSLPMDETGNEKKYPKDGVAYAIPGSARISLDLNGKTLASAEMPMAQFGTVFALSPALFTSKKEPSYATFSVTTGALETIGSVPSVE